MPKLHRMIQRDLPATEKIVVFVGQSARYLSPTPERETRETKKRKRSRKRAGSSRRRTTLRGIWDGFMHTLKLIYFMWLFYAHMWAWDRKSALLTMPYVWFIFTLCSTFVSISIHIVCTWHIDFQFSGVWTHCYPVLDCAVWSNPNDYTHMQMRWIGGYECKMIYGSKWLDHRTKHSRDHPDIKYACANIYNIYHILTFACTYYIFTHTHIYIYIQ